MTTMKLAPFHKFVSQREHMLRLLILTLFISAMPLSASAAESCPSMGVIATNYGNAAYQFTREEPKLIEISGFFDVWIDFLSIVLEKGEKSGFQSREFFSATKSAGSALIMNKADLTKTISSEGYVPMFSRMTIRFCEGLGASSAK